MSLLSSYLFTSCCLKGLIYLVLEDDDEEYGAYIDFEVSGRVMWQRWIQDCLEGGYMFIGGGTSGGRLKFVGYPLIEMEENNLK